jgi:hypothetical protein
VPRPRAAPGQPLATCDIPRGSCEQRSTRHALRVTSPERRFFSTHERVLDASMAIVEERLLQNGVEPDSTSVFVPSRWFSALQAICEVAPEGGEAHLIWPGTSCHWPTWASWGQRYQDCVVVQDENGRVLEKVQLPPHDEVCLWQGLSTADISTAVRVFETYSADGLPLSDLVRLGAALATPV